MFTGHMREADLKEIELINIDPEWVLFIYLFIYLLFKLGYVAHS